MRSVLRQIEEKWSVRVGCDPFDRFFRIALNEELLVCGAFHELTHAKKLDREGLLLTAPEELVIVNGTWRRRVIVAARSTIIVVKALVEGMTAVLHPQVPLPDQSGCVILLAKHGGH
jgi:hypothetical protein